ncbi:type II and III secretion system protein family protein [Amaricoccus sp.]|uniref:type II and III secretion system protein family protein n=1 Tax=Amaricoccus sp. TaxID=1872485 RepID=UPI001B6F95A2|nr:type II and III secretion system protein family protein [Amaricoccus sp.]MBP6999921.1 type II and III secretion system protein family protein [Amaricoccus sp.]
MTTRKHPRLAAAIAAALILQPMVAAAPGSAFEVIEPQEEREIAMTVGSGQLIKVDAEFSSLFVANPEVADVEVKSPRMLYLTGVGVGQTTIFAVDELDNVLMSATVHVTHNTDALNKGIARVAPGQSVTATSVDQSLVIAGTVASPEQAANIIEVANQFVDEPSRVVNRLAVAAPTQVNLAVRIAEVSRRVDRQLGIQWNELSYSSGGGQEQVRFSGGGQAATPGGFSTQILRVGQLNIDVVLQALAQEGLVSILAEPNLTARSGESASFLAGGEFPYTVAQDLGTNTIEFKDYGIGLNFTPTVLDGGRISLTIATEVSDLDFSNGTDIPSIVTRRADTTVDLGSGQTFAIAGLMQNRSSQDVSKMPGLGSVPVVGALFRSNGFTRGQTELVILVTPVIVSPTNGKRLRTPVDGYVPPNDFERIVLGRFQGNPNAASQAQTRLGSRRLNGASGFTFK